MAKRRIRIPEGTKCPACGSDDLIGHGTYWRINRNGDNPSKVKVQHLMCNKCGKFFADGEVNKSEVNDGKS